MNTLPAVAIVGAGLVGCSWAMVFARAGCRVSVYDADAAVRAAILPRISAALDDMEAAGLVSEIPRILARISVASELADAVQDAEYIQESAFERVDVKSDVSARIGALMRPDAIVGSSSSGIPASRFTEAVEHRNRFMIVHPVNPPHLIPLVEIVPAPWTDPAIVPVVRALMERVGQVPMTVQREVEGFVLNRLQGALLNEAWRLFDEGYATIEDIDRTVRDGLGLRWAFMGPFETIDLNAPGGIADYARRLAPLYHRIAQQSQTPEPWPDALVERAEAERRSVLAEDELVRRGQWRDRQLMALIAHRQRTQSDR